MTPARLTPAEARRLGIDTPRSTSSRSRRTARGTYHTRCHDCGERFLTVASEGRHLDDTGHHRFEVVIDP